MAPSLAQQVRLDRSFERLYRRHSASVYRYALAVLQNEADAEDITQVTFLNAFRALERGERPRAPHNWLIAIAHNACRQRFRQSARRPTEVAWEGDLADRLVEDDDVPGAEDIRRALSHLGFNQRAALVMRELEGRSYAEIAEVLGVSASAVETLIFRARRALREQLEGGLACADAERAISRQLDGRLSRAEKGALRAHLRECPECATLARRQRAQRSAVRSLGALPLPASLGSLLGGGGSSAGVAVAAKAAAVAAAAVVAGGAGYESYRHAVAPPHRRAPAAAAAAPAAAAPALRPAVALLPERVAERRAGAQGRAHRSARADEVARGPRASAGGARAHGRGARPAAPPGRAGKVAKQGTGHAAKSRGHAAKSRGHGGQAPGRARAVHPKGLGRAAAPQPRGRADRRHRGTVHPAGAPGSRRRSPVR